MGILDFLGGLGKAGAASPLTRLTSGLGSQGGLLSDFGLGRYGQAPGAGQGFHFGHPGGLIDRFSNPQNFGNQLGGTGSFTDFLHNLGGQMMQPGGFGSGQQDNQTGGQQDNQQPPGLGSIAAQWLRNQRQ